MRVYDYGEVTADVIDNLVTIVVTKKLRVQLFLEELADIADVVVQHIESAAEYIGAAPEPFFTEEDLEAGHQAIADLEVP